MSSQLTFQPQQKTILSREIYNALRKAIFDGDLKPGERIVEGVIAKQMNVSRAPLREAIKQLEKDGLVVVEAHRETRVISPTSEDIRELLVSRVVLETVLYQFAAHLLGDPDLACMEDFVSRMEKAATEKDSRELAKWDYEFHDKLCFTAGLPRLYRIWHEQHILLRLWLNVVAETHDRDIMRTATSHRAILDAVRARDNEAIAARVFYHVYHVGPALATERADWAAEMSTLFPLKYQSVVPASPELDKHDS